MQNPASVLENDAHKLLWDFDIQRDHLISARRPDLIIINKKKKSCKIVDFTPFEFFTSALADGLTLEFERQQVSSSLQGSSQYSGRS